MARVKNGYQGDGPPAATNEYAAPIVHGVPVRPHTADMSGFAPLASPAGAAKALKEPRPRLPKGAPPAPGND